MIKYSKDGKKIMEIQETRLDEKIMEIQEIRLDEKIMEIRHNEKNFDSFNH